MKYRHPCTVLQEQRTLINAQHSQKSLTIAVHKVKQVKASQF